MKIHIQVLFTDPDHVQEMDINLLRGDTFQIVDQEGIKLYLKAEVDQSLVVLPKTETKVFCHKVRRLFERTFTSLYVAEHYDTADLVGDLSEFLKPFGIEVSGEV